MLIYQITGKHIIIELVKITTHLIEKKIINKLKQDYAIINKLIYINKKLHLIVVKHYNNFR